MALNFDGDKITGSGTRHTAILVRYTGAEEGTGWRVSWLPGRLLDRNQAVTAMMIADTAGRGAGLSDDPMWPQLDGWAAELGMGGAVAVVRASEPPPEPAAGE